MRERERQRRKELECESQFLGSTSLDAERGVTERADRPRDVPVPVRGVRSLAGAKKIGNKRQQTTATEKKHCDDETTAAGQPVVCAPLATVQDALCVREKERTRAGAAGAVWGATAVALRGADARSSRCFPRRRLSHCRLPVSESHLPSLLVGKRQETIPKCNDSRQPRP